MSEAIPKISGAQRGGLPLKSAITHNAGNMRDGHLWFSFGLRIKEELGTPLSKDNATKWISLDIELTNEVLSRLRASEWIAEGFKPGATDPERPACSWWQNPVDLDLWNETVQWNGVELHGLTVYSAADTPDLKALAEPKPQKMTSNSMLRDFVKAFIERVRSEDHEPTELKLNEAWHDAGYRGRREDLKTELVVQLKRPLQVGRPAKIRRN